MDLQEGGFQQAAQGVELVHGSHDQRGCRGAGLHEEGLLGHGFGAEGVVGG